MPAVHTEALAGRGETCNDADGCQLQLGLRATGYWLVYLMYTRWYRRVGNIFRSTAHYVTTQVATISVHHQTWRHLACAFHAFIRPIITLAYAFYSVPLPLPKSSSNFAYAFHRYRQKLEVLLLNLVHPIQTQSNKHESYVKLVWLSRQNSGQSPQCVRCMDACR